MYYVYYLPQWNRNLKLTYMYFLLMSSYLESSAKLRNSPTFKGIVSHLEEFLPLESLRRKVPDRHLTEKY
jgi:hypothetical protein